MTPRDDVKFYGNNKFKHLPTLMTTQISHPYGKIIKDPIILLVITPRPPSLGYFVLTYHARSNYNMSNIFVIIFYFIYL